MKVHHFGYCVSNLEESIKKFTLLFNMKILKGPLEDPNQKVRIAFLITEDNIVLELLEPTGKDSPVYGKIGLVHVCFECENLLETVKDFEKKGFLLVRKIEKAKAIENKEIAFLFNKKIGLIELIQK